MRRSALFLSLFFAALRTASAEELTGRLSIEGFLFFDDPAASTQKRDDASLALQFEYHHEWEDHAGFVFVPFARGDTADPERSHYDIRELNVNWVGPFCEIRAGIGKVFWGSTEFLHLVDIVNQTDLVESIDGEEKLGQPMIHLSLPGRWGTADFFALPYFRERTFPGAEGRFRTPLAVDAENPRYENADKEKHLDFAVRYSLSLLGWDIGLSHFEGTGRDPDLLPGFNEKGETVLVPFYPKINQTSLDLQGSAGEWLFKLETLHRQGQGDAYWAATGGFEYSFIGLAGSRTDLGIVGEWAWDERDDEAPTPYENDALIGLRVTPNDAAGTEFLAGLAQDIDSHARALSIETGRRIGSDWRISLEAWSFFDPPEEDLYDSFRKDDSARLELTYYF